MRWFRVYYPGDNPVTGEKNSTHYTVFGVEVWRYKYSNTWKQTTYRPPRFGWHSYANLATFRTGKYIYCVSLSNFLR